MGVSSEKKGDWKAVRGQRTLIYENNAIGNEKCKVGGEDMERVMIILKISTRTTDRRLRLLLALISYLSTICDHMFEGIKHRITEHADGESLCE